MFHPHLEMPTSRDACRGGGNYHCISYSLWAGIIFSDPHSNMQSFKTLWYFILHRWTNFTLSLLLQPLIMFKILQLDLKPTLFMHYMTSYHLRPIIVAKHFLKINLAYAWVNLWFRVSNLLVWRTGECIVVGSSSTWTKIREHICVIRVFFCVFATTKAWRNNYSENWTAWQGQGCDWA